MGVSLEMVRAASDSAVNVAAAHFSLALSKEGDTISRERAEQLISDSRAFALKGNASAYQRASTKVG